MECIRWPTQPGVAGAVGYPSGHYLSCSSNHQIVGRTFSVAETCDLVPASSSTAVDKPVPANRHLRVASRIPPPSLSCYPWPLCLCARASCRHKKVVFGGKMGEPSWWHTLLRSTEYIPSGTQWSPIKHYLLQPPARGRIHEARMNDWRLLEWWLHEGSLWASHETRHAILLCTTYVPMGSSPRKILHHIVLPQEHSLDYRLLPAFRPQHHRCVG